MRKTTLTGISILVFLFFIVGFSQAAETIKVGVPVSMTGPYAGDGTGYYNGVKFAVDKINESGGLLGKKLEIVRFDTKEFAPEIVMQAADQLVNNEKVDSIHAGWAGWGQDVRAYGKYDVPTFVLDASISAISVFKENPKRYSNWYQMNDIERQISIDMFDVMATLPYQYPNKKIVVITADDSWGLESGSGFKERAKEKGWKVAMDEIVPYGTREWRPILARINTIKPAIIYVEIVSAPDLMTFFRQFMKSPTQSLITFGYGLTPPDFLENMGAEANDLMGWTYDIPGPEAPTALAKQWRKEFKDRYKTEPAGNTYQTYAGLNFWAEAVKAVGDAKNYEAINQFLSTNSYTGLDGRTLKFDQDNKTPINSWALSHLQVQNGKNVTIYVGPGKKYLDYQFQVPRWIKK